MKYSGPPVDEEITEVITTDGRRIPVAVRRDVQEIDPVTRERRFIRTISHLPGANGQPLNPDEPLTGCQVCGAFPLNESSTRRCTECEHTLCLECVGARIPAPEGTHLYLCTVCTGQAQRHWLIQYLFSLE